jgi:hypothetical protein
MAIIVRLLMSIFIIYFMATSLGNIDKFSDKNSINLNNIITNFTNKLTNKTPKDNLHYYKNIYIPNTEYTKIIIKYENTHNTNLYDDITYIPNGRIIITTPTYLKEYDLDDYNEITISDNIDNNTQFESFGNFGY